MNATPSFFTKFGPILFYLLEIPTWMLLALPILAGGDARKILGLLGFLATPLYGLFIFASLAVHIFFLATQRHQYIKPLLLANVIGIVGYAFLTISVTTWALYR